MWHLTPYNDHKLPQLCGTSHPTNYVASICHHLVVEHGDTLYFSHFAYFSYFLCNFLECWKLYEKLREKFWSSFVMGCHGIGISRKTISNLKISQVQLSALFDFLFSLPNWQVWWLKQSRSLLEFIGSERKRKLATILVWINIYTKYFLYN